MWASECRACLCLITLVLLEPGSSTTASELVVDLYWLIRFFFSPLLKHEEVVSTCTGCPLPPVKLLADILSLIPVLGDNKREII